jgi:phosphoglycolate phosphatase
MKTLRRQRGGFFLKKLVIFDLDGTLFDTTASMEACGNEALRRLQLPTFSRKDYARFSGGGVEGYVSAILDAVGDTEHRNFDLFWQYYQEKNSQIFTSLNRPYEKVPKLLAILKEKGIRLAVLSNKDQPSCRQIVEECFGKNCFDVIRGDTGIAPVKPDPSGVYAILEELGVAKEDCLYVGDTEVDMITGKNAAVPTVAALWGYRSREELAVFEPELEAASPLDLLDLCLA